jgi:DNA-binding transcriptional ArsR family regulator
MWAIAHPLRFRMMELLREGPSTAARLARRLGHSRGSTSYHLRILAGVGAIVEAPELGTRRERWWKRAEDFVVLPADTDTEGKAIIERVVSVLFARDAEVRRRFLTSEVSDEWRRSACVGNWFIRLTPAQADALGIRLYRMVDEVRRLPQDPDVDLVLVSVSVLPVLGDEPQ